jgi:5-formyltetrahydrofolate cyclo-ligase
MGNPRKEIREEMKVVLANLDQRWYKAASLELCDQLNKLVDDMPRTINHILLFQPILPGSVDLTAFLKSQLEQGRRVYIPCGESDSISFYEVKRDAIEEHDLATLRLMQCNLIVDEPYTGNDAEHTLVIMPGLAYDVHGNRIGRGKLSYEQLMSRPGMGRAIEVGVCWSLQLLDEMPLRSTDLLVDFVCHERGCKQTGILS